MKKYTFITLAAVVAAGSAQAQNLVDAVRFSSSDLGGTARYRSMAGAFGALGGDPSCMGDNPAGIAIYRGTNVLTITPNLSFTTTEVDGSVKTKEKKNNTSIANFSSIFSFKAPDSDNLVNFTLGLGFERRQENFRKYNMQLNNPASAFGDYLAEQANSYLDNRTLASSLGYKEDAYGNIVYDPWDESDAPTLTLLAYDAFAIDEDLNNKYRVINPTAGLQPEQAMRVREENRHDEYNISGAFNINDVFYVGATLKLTDFNSTIVSEFDEFYPESPTDALFYDNSLETKGSGIGLNLGILWKPSDDFRVGAAIHTPTWMNMTEMYSSTIQTCYEAPNDNGFMEKYEPWSSYNSSWEYDFQTPWEYQLSAAAVLGTRALLSVEWDMRDFTTMEFNQSDNYKLNSSTMKYLNAINSAFKDHAQMQHTIKVGMEYRLTPNLSARAGYSYITSPYASAALNSEVDSYNQELLYSSSSKLNYNTLDNQQYITAGFGWRGSNWYVDLSCVNHFTNEYIAAYPADYANSVYLDMSMYRINWDLTLGYRF